MDEISINEIESFEEILKNFYELIISKKLITNNNFKTKIFSIKEIIKKIELELENSNHHEFILDVNKSGTLNGDLDQNPTPLGLLKKKNINLLQIKKQILMKNKNPNNSLTFPKEVKDFETTIDETPFKISNYNKEFDEIILNEILYFIDMKLSCLIEDHKKYLIMKIRNSRREEFLMKLDKSINNDKFINEMKTFKRMQNSRYSIKMLKNGIINDTYPYVILENINFQNFKQSLKKHISGIEESKIFFFFIQIYFSLCEMHFNGVIKNKFNIDDIIFNQENAQIYIFKFNSIVVEEITSEVKEQRKLDTFNLGKILVEILLICSDIYYNKGDDLLSLVFRILTSLSKELKNFVCDLVNTDKNIDLIDIQNYEWFKINKNKLFVINANNLKELFLKI